MQLLFWLEGLRTPFFNTFFELLTHLYTDSRGGYAYPALQYEDGKLHISYTWDRLSIVYMCLTDI